MEPDIIDVQIGLAAPAYDNAFMQPYYQKTEAILRGTEQIQKQIRQFLPKFADESETEYLVRSKITKYTNIYRDVVEGLATKPFEEEVSLVGGENNPQEIVDFVNNVDGAKNNLTMFSAQTFFDGINFASSWILVDFPPVDPNVVKTQQDVIDQKLRPFWVHILAANVLEVRSKIVNGNEVLTYFRVLEPNPAAKDRVRIYERAEDGRVFWSLYEKAEKVETEIDKQQWVRIEGGEIAIGIIPMVPFITGRRDGKSFRFFPVMQDAADLQITLFQDESALQFIKTLGAYPMLAANGIRPEMDADGKTPKRVAVGPMRVLYGSVDPNTGKAGEWTFIEPSAQSMEFLQKNITTTKQDLRELGRQPLTALSSQLTTVTTTVAAGKARSAVSAWALALKDTLENALDITALWMGLTYDAKINVFTDFDSFIDGGQDLVELGKARERGDLSLETYLAELKRRKVLSNEFDFKQETKRLLNEIPSDPSEDEEPEPSPGTVA